MLLFQEVYQFQQVGAFQQIQVDRLHHLHLLLLQHEVPDHLFLSVQMELSFPNLKKYESHVVLTTASLQQLQLESCHEPLNDNHTLLIS